MSVNRIKKNKGFSLVELIVVLLITGILLVSAGSVYLIALKTYTRAGDINYKEGSVTNIETELQNSLAKAMVIGITQAPGGDYSIGFNAFGKCVIGNGEYGTDQIKDIQLEIKDDTMTYKLIPKDNSMTTLSGGIVLNNLYNPNFNGGDFVNGNLNKDLPRYLVITFARP